MSAYSNTVIEQICCHHIGNKGNQEALQLSESFLDVSDTVVYDLLMKYFLSPFSKPEFYAFTSDDGAFLENPIYQMAAEIFDDPDTFQQNSGNIAKLLYDFSIHPQIPAGDLFVVYFSGMGVDDDFYDGIGLFKTESKQTFLKVNQNSAGISVLHEEGFNPEKPEKGCLILNHSREKGFRVCVIEKTDKAAGEVPYWKDNFLKLVPFKDEYNNTKEFMSIARDFVATKITEDFKIDKAGQMDLLNRSMGYFKSNDNFSRESFVNDVFQQPEVIESFANFESVYKQEKNIELPNEFEISDQAVKKQARIFKSVLKLDRNFHIYIHGNSSLIEKGAEEDGRKYYKIYFNEEH